MQITISTKYDVGNHVFVFEKEHLSGCVYKGYIFKVTILAITITENTYVYETSKGLFYEKDIFRTLKEAKQWARDAGYIVGGGIYGKVKYCG